MFQFSVILSFSVFTFTVQSTYSRLNFNWELVTVNGENRICSLVLELLSKRNRILFAYQFGIPPTNTSELVANFPKWNSLPREDRVCDALSTVNVVCSSFRWIYFGKEKGNKKKKIVKRHICYKISNEENQKLIEISTECRPQCTAQRPQ